MMKKLTVLLSLFVVLISLTSCFNLINTPASGENPATETEEPVQRVYHTISGSIGTRGAVPDIIDLAVNGEEAASLSVSRMATASPLASVLYIVTAVPRDSGLETITTTPSSSRSFLLNIESGTYDITASAYNASSADDCIDENKILEGTTEYTVGQADPLKIIIEAFGTTSSSGQVDLSITVEGTSVVQYSYSLTNLDDSSVTYGGDVRAVTSGLASISESDIPAGIYELSLTFYDSSTNVIIRHNDRVNVFNSMITNIWKSVSARGFIKNDGSFEVTETDVQFASQNEYYVDPTVTTNGTYGSMFDPFQTIEEAFEVAKGYGKESATINIKAGTSCELSETIDTSTVKNLVVKTYGNTDETDLDNNAVITRASDFTSEMFVLAGNSQELTLKNLTLVSQKSYCVKTQYSTGAGALNVDYCKFECAPSTSIQAGAMYLLAGTVNVSNSSITGSNCSNGLVYIAPYLLEMDINFNNTSIENTLQTNYGVSITYENSSNISGAISFNECSFSGGLYEVRVYTNSHFSGEINFSKSTFNDTKNYYLYTTNDIYLSDGCSFEGDKSIYLYKGSGSVIPTLHIEDSEAVTNSQLILATYNTDYAEGLQLVTSDEDIDYSIFTTAQSYIWGIDNEGKIEKLYHPFSEYDNDNKVQGNYLISTEEDLKNLRDYSQSYDFSKYEFYLANDIALTEEWTTSLFSGSYAFKGIFDGQNNKITGLNLSTSANYTAFFGKLGAGTIKNLYVSGNIEITTSGSAGACSGGLVGSSSSTGTISNCVSDIDIYVNSTGTGTSPSYIGGICGYAGYITIITNCVNSGSIICSGNVEKVAGILGFGDTVATSTYIYNCANFGYINCANASGITYGSSKTYVDNCISAGLVIGSGSVLVSQATNASASALYYDSDLGKPFASTSTDTATPVTDVSDLSSTLSGRIETLSSTLTDTSFNTWDKTFLYEGMTYPIPVSYEGLERSNFPETCPEYDYINNNNNIINVFNYSQLLQISNWVNSGEACIGREIHLYKDITLISNTWVCIGNAVDNSTPFGGQFYGHQHTIDGLSVTYSASEYRGMFGSVTAGTIQDLTVNGSITATGVSDAENIGGIVCNAYSINMYNCVSYVAVTGLNSTGSGTITNAGGLIGRAEGVVNVYNCVSFASVSGKAAVGGIIGGLYSEYDTDANVVNCAFYGLLTTGNTSTINGSEGYGGIVGYMDLVGACDIENCISSARLTSSLESYCGTIVGAIIDDASKCNSMCLQYNYHNNMSIGPYGTSVLSKELVTDLPINSTTVGKFLFSGTEFEAASAYTLNKSNVLDALNEWVLEKNATGLAALWDTFTIDSTSYILPVSIMD